MGEVADEVEIDIRGTVVRALKGDLTNFEADALVNAANNRLWMGGGVAGALKRRGGEEIEREAVKKGPIPVGEAIAATAGGLKAKYVIHAAGMGTDLQTDERKIMDATKNSLRRADELNLESIAFPSIGTGVGGFPVDKAAEVMVSVVKEHLIEGTTLKEITFVLYDDVNYKAFEERLKDIGQKYVCM